MKIIISPYSAVLRSGNPNPKNYPHFSALVKELNTNGHEIIQIGVAGEARIEGVAQYIVGWPWNKLKAVFNDAVTWISVDNAIQHFCHCERLKPGIVLWGKSSPRIFGYPENDNLFVSESYFRPFQFQHWESELYEPSVFVPPMQVVWAVERAVVRSRNPQYAATA